MTRAPIHDLHASNLLTYGSLASAVVAIAFAHAGSRSGAGACLALAAILDTFDGRFARRFTRSPRQSRLGGELDSLVDAAVFGVAPVVLVTLLSGGAHGGAALARWLACFLYVLAALTRLAFYNVQEDDSVFVGLPTPAAGLLWSTYLLRETPTWVATLLLVIIGAAMIWPFRFPRPRGAGLAAFALWAAALVVLHVMR